MAVLTIDNVTKRYGELVAVDRVSFEAQPGRILGLLGPNGAGKTSTIRMIAYITIPDEGAIRFDGAAITRTATHEIAEAGIGWVPEDRRIFPTLTVERNLAIARKKSRYREWRLSEIFEIFPALEYLMQREGENLSGGEMQMVSIARALLGSPGLLLFDEPSQGLAHKIVQDVMKTIARLKQEGISVLVVEQNATAALTVSDRAYVMDLGRIVHEGPARALLEDATLRTKLLGI